MKTAKLGAMFLVSVLALAGASAGYALWSETLTIGGTLTTGNVDVDWSLEGCRKVGDPKDISTITATIDVNTITVTITDAYPCVDYYVDWNVHCVGSIPVHFDAWTITHDLPTNATFELTDLDYRTTGIQLHYDDYEYGTLHIHLDNDATELTTYTFSATVTAGQYNEWP